MNKKTVYLKIRRHKKLGNHPHLVLNSFDNKIWSIGLTSSKKSGHHKLIKVVESNGRTAYLRQNSIIDFSANYSLIHENFHLRKIDEVNAKKIAKKRIKDYTK